MGSSLRTGICSGLTLVAVLRRNNASSAQATPGGWVRPGLCCCPQQGGRLPVRAGTTPMGHAALPKSGQCYPSRKKGRATSDLVACRLAWRAYQESCFYGAVWSIATFGTSGKARKAMCARWISRVHARCVVGRHSPQEALCLASCRFQSCSPIGRWKLRFGVEGCFTANMQARPL